MTAPTFKEWFESRANPLRGASQIAQHFTQDALQAAFKAGEECERDKWRVKREKAEDTFTFGGSSGAG